jgi:chemotaxis protein methyltransferase CheR
MMSNQDPDKKMSAAAFEQNDGYQHLQLVLQDEFGIVLGDERRSFINARLQPVIDEFVTNDLHGLADRLSDAKSVKLRNAVLLAITSYTTIWFEPAELFALLADYVLPGLLDRRSVRIWIIGCGSGALPYSVSMAVTEALKLAGRQLEVKIVTSDIDESVMAQAREAVYDQSSLRNLDENRMHKYMTAEGDNRRVKDDIRSRVTFSTCNLLDDFSGMGHFDVVICLDTLMYFSVAIKRHILDGIAGLLAPSGILLVGPNETVIPLSRDFDRVEIDAGVFYRQKR